MANIPLADIPNAPRINVGAPDLGAEMGALQGTVSRFVTNNQQKEAPKDFGQSPFKALENVGESLGKVGTAAGSLALEEAKAKSEYQVNEGRTTFETEFQNFKSGIRPGDDPDQLRKNWEERNKAVLGQVMSNPELSPAAKQRLQIEAMRFSQVSSADINTTAAKLTFERAKTSLQEQADTYLNSGNLDGAKAVYRKMAADKLIFPDQVTALEQAADNKHELFTYGRQIDADPKAAREKLATLQNEDGTTKGTKLSVEQIAKLTDAADMAMNQKKTAIIQELSKMAETNLLRDRKQIEDLGQGYLNEADIAVLDQKRQGQQPPDWEKYSDLLARAHDYDSAKDKDGQQAYEINRDIVLLPEGWREHIRSEFNAAKKPNSQLNGLYATRINDLLKMGYFGDATKDKQDQPKDATQYASAHEASAKLLFNLTQFSKSNPTAGPEEYARWFKDNAQQYKYTPPPSPPSNWNPFNWFKGKEEPSTMDRYAAIASSAKPIATGTTYGYKSDPYRDSASLARVGAFTAPSDKSHGAYESHEGGLKEGDVALSPDLEKKFRAAGVEPLDMVKLTFSDGTSTTVRWADRTMQDAQATRKFGAPLRNRIDFFTPTGKTPFADKQITGFEKLK